MVNLDLAELRPKLDLDGKYVDFNLLRSALTVEIAARDLDVKLSDPTLEGERRGKCPKCGKDRSFCLNVATNRFKCFAKGCILKGGGVIDFFSKLYEVSAKEASHLLACAYGIQPYDSEKTAAAKMSAAKTVDETATETNREAENSLSENSANDSKSHPPLTAQHLIASIEHQLSELKQLLVSR